MVKFWRSRDPLDALDQHATITLQMGVGSDMYETNRSGLM
jgi:hypothetical protein